MRSLALSLLVFLCDMPASLAQFGPERPLLQPHLQGIRSSAAADFDMDGDIDVAVGTGLGELVLFPNTGTGGFDAGIHLQNIPDTYIRAVHAIDIDTDGDADLLVHHFNGVSCFINDGTGLGQPISIVDDPQSDPVSQVGDIDDDGDMDLMLGDYQGPTAGMHWLANDGNGHFAEMGYFSEWPTDDAAVGDLNNDGRSDILLAHRDMNAVSWYANEGETSFGTGTRITIGLESAFRVQCADLDHDGDLDVIYSSTDDDRIAWLPNDGSGSFGPEVVISTSGSTVPIVTADVDDDGDEDLFMSYNGYPKWVLNDGLGNFSPAPSLGAHAICLMIIPVDMDNDADIDVLNCTDTRIEWHENQNQGITWTLHPITDALTQGESVAAADIDGDGVVDVVSSAYDRLLWLKGTGHGRFATQPPISDQYMPEQIQLADLDNDGGPDILGVIQNDLVWMPNEGPGQFGAPVEIVVVAGEMSATMGDLDGDADLDIVYSDRQDDLMAWCRNNGDGTFSPPLMLAESVNGAADMHAIDLDNDGDLDVVGNAAWENDVLFFENDGSGGFAPGVTLFSGIQYVVAVAPADLDGDGDVDIAFGTQNPYQLRWRENTDMAFDIDHGIDSMNVSFMHSLESVDLSGDQIPDVCWLQGTVGTISWRKNDGAGSFGPVQVTTSFFLADQVNARVVADLDADQDLDLLLSTRSTVAWQENYATSTFNVQGTTYWDANANGLFDGNDVGLPSTVHSTPDEVYAFAGPDGTYRLVLNEGAYVIGSGLPSSLWTPSNDPATYDVYLTEQQPTVTGIDFGLHAVMDTTIAVIGLTSMPTLCGATVDQSIDIRNIGTTILRGDLSLVLDPEVTFISAVPAPASVDGQTIHWHVDSVFFESLHHIDLRCGMPSFASMGDTLGATVLLQAIDAQGQPTAAFHTTWSSVLLCAYDPNDKLVDPAGIGAGGNIDVQTPWINYTIRFQNTGTATATNVVLRDVLDPSFDPGSLTVLGYSHPLTSMAIEADGEAIFHFDNIFLPDTGTDLLGSQGYVRFRVKPLGDLPSGTSITNTAAIHFDANPPIITNTTRNTLIDCNGYLPLITLSSPGVLLASPGALYQWFLEGSPIPGETQQGLLAFTEGVYSVLVTNADGCTSMSDAFDIGVSGVGELEDQDMIIYPNPITDRFRLHFASPLLTNERVDLVDLNGRLVASVQGNGQRELSIERGDLASGIYLARAVRGSSIGTMVRLIAP